MEEQPKNENPAIYKGKNQDSAEEVIRQDGTRAVPLEQYSKEELIQQIKNLKKQLKTKNAFGLVFERQKEDAIIRRKTQAPVLEENKEKHVNNGVQENLLLIGDNIDSLTCLLSTHKGKIDVIYIDPPYNTGNESWVYNNDYVNKEDAFKHSKWLSFMESRLLIAKELLAEDGIIALAIDDYELPRIWMLFDAIFGEENRLGSISVVHKPEGRNQEKFFATSNEFMIVYAKNKTKANFNSVVLSDDKKYEYSLEDGKGFYKLSPYLRSGGGDVNLRKNKESFWYPIFVNESDGTVSLEDDGNTVSVYPITNSGVERTWQTKKDTLQLRINAGVIVAVKNTKNKFEIFEKYYANEKGQLVKTHWIDPRYSAISNGTNILNRIIGEGKFDYPKSLPLMEDIIKIMSPKDGIILDFFAGSGTTGHAVLNVNKEDNGTRKFILCTNDESNIGSSVTYQRIKNIIENNWADGKEHESHEASLRYFNVDFVDRDASSTYGSDSAVNKLDGLVCIAEDLYKTVYTSDMVAVYSNNVKGRFAAIVRDPWGLDELKEFFEMEAPNILTVYVNDSFADYRQELSEVVPEGWDVSYVSLESFFFNGLKYADRLLKNYMTVGDSVVGDNPVDVVEYGEGLYSDDDNFSDLGEE